MKTVIYKVGGIYHTTTEENYKARIQNARAIHELRDFSSAEEIINYYCKYFGSQTEDFKMSEPVAKEFLMSLGWNEYGADAILKELNIEELTVADLIKVSEDYKDR